MLEHIDSLHHYTYQYQLCVHLIGCVSVMSLALATGIQPAKIKPHGSRKALIVGALFLAIQVPVTLLRLNTAFDETWVIRNPLTLYVNFLWSPMCTVFVTWLYLTHLVSSCTFCDCALPRDNVDPSPNLRLLGLFLGLGVATSVFTHELLPLYVQFDDRWILRLYFGVALAAAPMEILFFRARYNKIRFFNASWAWFFGSWLYFLTKV